MKKFICSFLVIILSFALCCCNREQISKEKLQGEPLEDGTETYYINLLDENDLIIKSSHYDADDNLLDEHTYDYTLDLNGRKIKCVDTDTKTKERIETLFDKFKVKTTEIYYNADGAITDKKEFSANLNVKKSYTYSDGEETGYILYDYYGDNQLKTKTLYSLDGLTVNITTYYKGGLLYQIKEFDKNGLISKITKNTYQGEKLVKKTVFNGDFMPVESWDYKKSPAVHTVYKDGEPLKADKNR